MRRTKTMTLGMVLIFIGIQLNLVQTYVLTPRFSNFLSEHASQSDLAGPNATTAANPGGSAYNSPYYQASYASDAGSQLPASGRLGVPKRVATPDWLCWPVLFLGTVVFLHGLSMRGD